MSSPATAAVSNPNTPGQRLRNLRAAWPVLGFVVGFASCFYLLPQGIPGRGAEYLSLAVLAALDSVFGGVRAGAERRFRSDVFLSGFLVNMILAVGLVWIGTKIGVSDLFLAAVVTLGSRIFVNLSVIRRHWLEKPARGSE